MLIRSLTCIALLIAWSSSLLAADAPAEKKGPMDTIIPELSLNNASLEDAITFLQDAAPGFKAVVVREAGIPEDYPQLKIRLKRVSVSQIWQILQLSYPEMEIQPIGEPGVDALWHIRIRASDQMAANPSPGGVKVYRLTPVVELLASKAGKPNDVEAEKRALNQVLSLAKAALAQTSQRAEQAAVLQVHEETGTLIFKGNTEQRSALESVLEALNPPSTVETQLVAEARRGLASAERARDKALDALKQEREQNMQGAGRLDRELLEVRELLHKQQQISADRALDAEKLKIRLEASENSRKAKPVAPAADPNRSPEN